MRLNRGRLSGGGVSPRETVWGLLQAVSKKKKGEYGDRDSPHDEGRITGASYTELQDQPLSVISPTPIEKTPFLDSLGNPFYSPRQTRRVAFMPKQADLMQGTLDMLILKVLARTLHG